MRKYVTCVEKQTSKALKCRDIIFQQSICKTKHTEIGKKNFMKIQTYNPHRNTQVAHKQAKISTSLIIKYTI